MVRIKVPTQTLRTRNRQQNHIRKDTPHEDANDLSILVAVGRGLGRRQREPLADGRLDSRTGRGDKVTQLVGGTDDEGADGSWGELHEVDGDNAPGALHAELLKEGGGHDALVLDEGVRVEESAADDADYDDGEAAAEDLAGPAAEGAARQGAQVGDDLGDGDGVLGEFELVAQHGGVQILGAVGLEENIRMTLLESFSSYL